jgi:hypothetical protein
MSHRTTRGNDADEGYGTWSTAEVGPGGSSHGIFRHDAGGPYDDEDEDGQVGAYRGDRPWGPAPGSFAADLDKLRAASEASREDDRRSDDGAVPSFAGTPAKGEPRQKRAGGRQKDAPSSKGAQAEGRPKKGDEVTRTKQTEDAAASVPPSQVSVGGRTAASPLVANTNTKGEKYSVSFLAKKRPPIAVVKRVSKGVAKRRRASEDLRALELRRAKGSRAAAALVREYVEEIRRENEKRKKKKKKEEKEKEKEGERPSPPADGGIAEAEAETDGAPSVDPGRETRFGEICFALLRNLKIARERNDEAAYDAYFRGFDSSSARATSNPTMLRTFRAATEPVRTAVALWAAQALGGSPPLSPAATGSSLRVRFPAAWASFSECLGRIEALTRGRASLPSPTEEVLRRYSAACDLEEEELWPLFARYAEGCRALGAARELRRDANLVSPFVGDASNRAALGLDVRLESLHAAATRADADLRRSLRSLGDEVERRSLRRLGLELPDGDGLDRLLEVNELHGALNRLYEGCPWLLTLRPGDPADYADGPYPTFAVPAEASDRCTVYVAVVAGTSAISGAMGFYSPSGYVGKYRMVEKARLEGAYSVPPGGGRFAAHLRRLYGELEVVQMCVTTVSALLSAPLILARLESADGGLEVVPPEGAEEEEGEAEPVGGRWFTNLFGGGSESEVSPEGPPTGTFERFAAYAKRLGRAVADVFGRAPPVAEGEDEEVEEVDSEGEVDGGPNLATLGEWVERHFHGLQKPSDFPRPECATHWNGVLDPGVSSLLYPAEFRGSLVGRYQFLLNHMLRSAQGLGARETDWDVLRDLAEGLVGEEVAGPRAKKQSVEEAYEVTRRQTEAHMASLEAIGGELARRAARCDAEALLSRREGGDGTDRGLDAAMLRETAALASNFGPFLRKLLRDYAWIGRSKCYRLSPAYRSLKDELAGARADGKRNTNELVGDVEMQLPVGVKKKSKKNKSKSKSKSNANANKSGASGGSSKASSSGAGKTSGSGANKKASSSGAGKASSSGASKKTFGSGVGKASSSGAATKTSHQKKKAKTGQKKDAKQQSGGSGTSVAKTNSSLSDSLDEVDPALEPSATASSEEGGEAQVGPVGKPFPSPSVGAVMRRAVVRNWGNITLGLVTEALRTTLVTATTSRDEEQPHDPTKRVKRFEDTYGAAADFNRDLWFPEPAANATGATGATNATGATSATEPTPPAAALQTEGGGNRDFTLFSPFPPTTSSKNFTPFALFPPASPTTTPVPPRFGPTQAPEEMPAEPPADEGAARAKLQAAEAKLQASRATARWEAEVKEHEDACAAWGKNEKLLAEANAEGALNELKEDLRLTYPLVSEEMPGEDEVIVRKCMLMFGRERARTSKLRGPKVVPLDGAKRLDGSVESVHAQMVFQSPGDEKTALKALAILSEREVASTYDMYRKEAEARGVTTVEGPSTAEAAGTLRTVAKMENPPVDGSLHARIKRAVSGYALLRPGGVALGGGSRSSYSYSSLEGEFYRHADVQTDISSPDWESYAETVVKAREHHVAYKTAWAEGESEIKAESARRIDALLGGKAKCPLAPPEDAPPKDAPPKEPVASVPPAVPPSDPNPGQKGKETKATPAAPSTPAAPPDAANSGESPRPRPRRMPQTRMERVREQLRQINLQILDSGRPLLSSLDELFDIPDEEITAAVLGGLAATELDESIPDARGESIPGTAEARRASVWSLVQAQAWTMVGRLMGLGVIYAMDRYFLGGGGELLYAGGFYVGSELAASTFRNLLVAVPSMEFRPAWVDRWGHDGDGFGSKRWTARVLAGVFSGGDFGAKFLLRSKAILLLVPTLETLFERCSSLLSALAQAAMAVPGALGLGSWGTVGLAAAVIFLGVVLCKLASGKTRDGAAPSTVVSLTGTLVAGALPVVVGVFLIGAVSYWARSQLASLTGSFSGALSAAWEGLSAAWGNLSAWGGGAPGAGNVTASAPFNATAAVDRAYAGSFRVLANQTADFFTVLSDFAPENNTATGVFGYPLQGCYRLLSFLHPMYGETCNATNVAGLGGAGTGDMWWSATNLWEGIRAFLRVSACLLPLWFARHDGVSIRDAVWLSLPGTSAALEEAVARGLMDQAEVAKDQHEERTMEEADGRYVFEKDDVRWWYDLLPPPPGGGGKAKAKAERIDLAAMGATEEEKAAFAEAAEVLSATYWADRNAELNLCESSEAQRALLERWREEVVGSYQVNTRLRRRHCYNYVFLVEMLDYARKDPDGPLGRHVVKLMENVKPFDVKAPEKEFDNGGVAGEVPAKEVPAKKDVPSLKDAFAGAARIIARRQEMADLLVDLWKREFLRWVADDGPFENPASADLRSDLEGVRWGTSGPKRWLALGGTKRLETRKRALKGRAWSTFAAASLSLSSLTTAHLGESTEGTLNRLTRFPREVVSALADLAAVATVMHVTYRSCRTAEPVRTLM